MKIGRINSSSLFHFTRRLDTLKKILANGLRYSFAYEQLPKEVVMSYLSPGCDTKGYSGVLNGVAIPMISFCDIPITRASQHIEKYGQYMIGFDKINLAEAYKNLINPVIYIHSPNLSDAITMFGTQYLKSYRELFDFFSIQNIKEKFASKTEQELLTDRRIMAEVDRFAQARFFSNFLMGLVKPIEDETHYYYDEREWRLFLPEKTNNIYWKWWITKEEYEHSRFSWNKDLEDSDNSDNVFIKIPSELYDIFITHIVVSKERQVDTLIKFIMRNDTLLGFKNDDVASRMKLISKITSFERIEKDF